MMKIICVKMRNLEYFQVEICPQMADGHEIANSCPPANFGKLNKPLNSKLVNQNFSSMYKDAKYSQIEIIIFPLAFEYPELSRLLPRILQKTTRNIE